VVGGGGLDRRRGAAGDARGGRVGRRQRLAARLLEGGAEGARAAGQRVVGRQPGAGAAAGEGDRAGVGRGRVVEGVLGRHREGVGAGGRRGGAGRGAQWAVEGCRGVG